MPKAAMELEKAINPTPSAGYLRRGKFQIHAAAAPDDNAEFSFTFSQRKIYLKKYGSHAMAFSALQPGMEFFDLKNVGYIAFRKQWGCVVCLGDPICARQDTGRLLEAFFEKYPDPVFIQVSPDAARRIREKTGFYTTQFGRESVIDLQNWSLSGKKKQVIRTAVNHAKRAGITIREGDKPEGFESFSDAWLATRKCRSREIIFLIRPMKMDYTEGIRCFSAWQDETLMGFAFFDPVYKDGRVDGYVPNISRGSEKFPQGIFYILMAHAMEVFREEGVPFMYLGLSPLAMDYPVQPFESDWLRWIMGLTERHFNFLYNFKGIDFTKSRFRGKASPTYAIHRRRLPLKAFAAMFRLCNVI